MQRTLLLAKIHNCTLTGANMNYSQDDVKASMKSFWKRLGSYLINKCKIVNSANGQRFITYMRSRLQPISGVIRLNEGCSTVSQALFRWLDYNDLRAVHSQRVKKLLSYSSHCGRNKPTLRSAALR